MSTIFTQNRKRGLLISFVLLFLSLYTGFWIFYFAKPGKAEAAWYNGSWQYRKALTFDNSGQGTNLTNFPVMVKLSNDTFDFAAAQATGADLRFTDSDGTTVLNYEIEKFDATNKSAIIWVQVPQVDASSTTDSIYLYWGNPKAATTADADATWNSGYKGVYHLNDSATTTTVSDSSGNANTITASANTSTQYASASGQLAGSFLTMGTPHRLPNIGAQNSELYPTLQLDSNNYPVVAYYENNTADLIVVHCNDLDCTGDNESVTAPDATGVTGQYPSLQLDSNGYPVIAYYDASATDLNVLHCNDANCAGGDDTISSVDTTGSVGAYASLVLDSNGYPVIAYYDTTNTNVKLTHCNDANCAGGNESTVTIDGATSTVGSSIHYISITLDSSGYPVIAYTDATNTDLKMTRCNDANCAGGDDTPSTIVTSANDTGRYPTIRLDSNSYPMITFEDWTLRDTYYLHCNDTVCAGGDDTPVAVESGTGDYPTFELNASGYPVVVYSDSGVYARIAVCSDATCSSTTKTYLHLYSSYGGSYPVLDFDSNWNLVTASYSRGKDGQYDINLYTTKHKLKQAYDADFDFGTGSFSISTWIKSKASGKTQNNFLLSRYDADQGFKLWLDYAGEPCFGIDDDSSWGPDDRACPTMPNYVPNVDNGNASSAIWSSLQLDSSGYPVIAYFDGGAVLDLELLHCTDANCSGTKNFASIDSTGDVGRTPSMVLDGSGFPVIAYHDNTTNDLKIAHCGDANCSSGNTINTIDSADDVGDYPSLKLDSLGYPVIAYYDTTNTALKLIHCNDANCSGGDESTVTAESANTVGQYPSLQLDSNGYPVISHYDATNGDLRLLHCNDANCSGGDETATNVDSTATTGFFASMQLDSNGYPVIAYHQASSLYLRLTHCSDANCTAKTTNNVATAYDTGYLTVNLALNASGNPVILHSSLAHFSQVLTTCNDANCAGADETHNIIRQGNTTLAVNNGNYIYSSFTLDSNGYPVVVIRDFNGDLGLLHLTSATYANSNSIDDGAWHHLVGVKNAASSLTLYVDGVAVATDSALAATATLTSNSATLDLAESLTNSLSENGWEGWLDEVQIDNTARSSNWISAQYKSESDNFITYGHIEAHPATDGPIASWKFDENQGQYANDSTVNKHHATLGATSGSSSDDPTWQANSMCISGSCLSFDGTNDYANVAQTVQRVKSIGFWIKPISTTTNILSLNGTAYISASSGTLSATGFDTPTIYVNGAVSSTITANSWQYVVVTTATAINASAITLGKVSTNYYQGFMDEVTLYNVALSAAQVKSGYNANAGTVLGTKSEVFLSNGLVGYWKTDEATWSGTLAEVIDSSGNGNHGQAAGATGGKAYPAAGKFGNAGFFDGVDDAILVPDNSTLDGFTSMSVFFWAKPTVSTTKEMVIKHLSTTSDINWELYQSGSNIAGRIVGTAVTCTSTGSLFTTNAWHQVGMTWNGVNIYIFIDGTLNNTCARSATMTNSVGNLSIGRYEVSSGSNYPFSGQMDELRIYNRALSAKEVSDLYSWAPGPVGYWNFDEGTGTNANDTSGNNYTGVITGATWTEGKYGQALNLDGNDYISVSNFPASSTTLGETGTAEAWVYLPTSQTAKGVFGFSANKPLYYFGSDGPQAYNADVNEYSANVTMPALSQWHYISYVWDNNTIKIYVDGILRTSDTSWETTFNRSSGTLNLGSYNGGGNAMIGKLDDVKIYNYARTSGQIVEDMNAGHPLGGSPIGSQVGYWKFDEQQGQTANNSIAGSTNGTLGANSGSSTDDPTWLTSSSCRSNGCLSFDGSDYVTLGNISAYKIDSKTITFWAKPTSISGTTPIFSNGSGNYYAGFASTTQMFTSHMVTTGSQQTTAAGNGTMTIGSWHHYSYTWNVVGTSVTVKMYQDGVLKTSATYTTGYYTTYGTAFILGAYTSGSLFYTGLLDEVKIYNSALTADQIKLDYNAGSSVKYSVGNDEAADLSDGAGNPPVAEWKFDEKTGNANDTSGNGYTGTLSGGTNWVSGKVGSAVDFDGTNGIATTAITTHPTSFTVEAWANADVSDGTNDTIISKFTGTPSYNGFFIRHNNGSVNAAVYSGGTGYSSSSTITAGVWSHWAMTFDGSTIRLYKNGVQVDSDAGTMGSNTTALIIGGNYGGATEPFNGKIDQVKYYDSVRTSAQVAYDYNRGAPVAHWKFDECTGTTINDAMGNIAAGTLTIGATVPQTSAGTCTTIDTATAWYNGRNGKFGSSVKLDGADDTASLPDTDSIDFTYDKDFSVSFWVKGTGNANGDALVEKWTGGVGGYPYVFRINASNSALFARYDGTNNPAEQGATNVEDNSWHHILGVKNGSSLILYIDGAPNGAATTDTTTGTTTNASAVYLASRGGASQWYAGQIDDVRIYNYALSASQVKKVMNEGSAVRFGALTGSP